MKKERFSIEDISRAGDLKLKEIINLAAYDKRDAITPLFRDAFEGDIDEDQFKEAFFSNTKLDVVKKLAELEGIENPASKEAWNKVIEKYPLERLRSFSDEVAEYEFRRIRPRKE